MNYSQTIDFLFSRLPMFSRIGAAAFKKDLTNTIRFCEFLGHPHKKFRSIHIAGTNGKGSVSHMMAAILQTAGYKTGLYTSPHLKDFRERIRIDGGLIPESFVIDFTEKIKPLIDEIEPSFFEITVAMAFDYFASEGVDIAVIEVGLGGRFDSTNVITPEISVITNISYDHMNMLGDTLEKIAYEKAGIIKQGIPAVIGETQAVTEPVFRNKAEEMQAPLYFAPRHFQVTDWAWKEHRLRVDLSENGKTDHHHYELDLPGIYQLKNLVTVLETTRVLRNEGWEISSESIHRALLQVKKTTGLHGRWELIHQHPPVILEVAHNEDGIRQMAEQIRLTDHQHLHLVIGIVKDKDPEKILALLPKNAYYYFTQAHIPRAMDALSLKQHAYRHALSGQVYHDVNQALKAALDKARPKDLVLVCGSIFLIAEVNH